MESKGIGNGNTLLSAVTRRDFMKFCTAVAATMGLPVSMAPRIAEAVTSAQRPPVIWLSGQECTGCIESLLRTGHPTLEHLIFDLISLEYSETLNAGAGHQAEAHRAKAIEQYKGKFILVVDGAIPVKDGGVYCMIAGKPVLEILNETAPLAAAVIAIGSCASWGGVPSADPNPTGATPVTKSSSPRASRWSTSPAARPILQLPVHGHPFPDLQQAPGPGRQGTAQVRLQPHHPRELRAAAPLRRRPLCRGVRRRWPPGGLLPVQAGLQGSGNLQQLLHPALQRHPGLLAGGHRLALLWLLRGEGRLPQPAVRQGQGGLPDPAGPAAGHHPAQRAAARRISPMVSAVRPWVR